MCDHLHVLSVGESAEECGKILTVESCGPNSKKSMRVTHINQIVLKHMSGCIQYDFANQEMC